MERLTHLEQDALEELLRLQVGRASDVLAALTPGLCSTRFVGYACGDGLPNGDGWCVHQRVQGELEGYGRWVLHRDDGLALVRRLRLTPRDDVAMTALEREGLAEVGHILIDELLEGITSSLGVRLSASVPTLCAVDAVDPTASMGVCAGLSHSFERGQIASWLCLRLTTDSGIRFRRALAPFLGPFLADLSAGWS